MRTNIGHILPTTTKMAAGLITSVKNISESLNNYQINSIIYSLDNYPNFFKKSLFIRSCKSKDKYPDIFHSHGIWRSQSSISNYFNTQRNIPNIISPHGMLDKWALNQNKIIKKIYWNFKEKEYLSKCSCIHALCKSEYNSIRGLGILNRIEIIPNSLEIPDKRYISRVSPINAKWFSNNIPKDYPYLLFLGRLHKKKGLNELIEAWIKMQNKKNLDVFLIIAGFGDFNKYQNLIKKNKISKLKFVGPCYGINKDLIMANASGFILPSFSEGLPMSALESLSWGIPTYITKECNLSEFISKNGAFQIKNDINSLSNTLENWAREVLNNSKELEIVGSKGREIIKKYYTNKVVGEKFTKLYQSIL